MDQPVRIRAGWAEGQHRPDAGALFADDLHAMQPRVGDDLVGLCVERAVVGASVTRTGTRSR
jgi:hypothetical protein